MSRNERRALIAAAAAIGLSMTPADAARLVEPTGFAEMRQLIEAHPEIDHAIFPGLSAAPLLMGGKKKVAGDEWSLIDPALVTQLYDVAFGDNVWVAVGTNYAGSKQIIRSTDDGMTWAAVAAPNPNVSYYAVVFGSGSFVAVGFDPSSTAVFARSTDGGLTWSSQSRAELGTYWFGVAHNGASSMYAVAQNGSYRGAKSTNGGFSFVDSAALNSEIFMDVGYHGTTVVAVSLNGVIRRSANDGVSFSYPTVPQTNGWRGVTHNGAGIWNVVGGSNSAWALRSVDDGITWSAVPATQQSEWGCVRYANNIWMACSSNGADRVMRSINDGSSWQPITVPLKNWVRLRGSPHGTWLAVAPVTSGESIMRTAA